jgi:hypothetical protein
VKCVDETNFEKETSNKNILGIDDVKKFDVLSGRGGKSNHHIGNKNFRNMVMEMKSDYRSKSTRAEKAALAESIVEKVYCMGGRFLIQNKVHFDFHWRLMTTVEARRKTSQALRETRKLKWTDRSSINFKFLEG